MSDRSSWKILVLAALVIALIPCCLFFGSVDIPSSEVVNSLLGRSVANERWSTIVVEMRLPMALTALLAGAGLAVAGLLLQTTFANPLAGPSILGVSTGASLGVGIVILVFGGELTGAGYYFGNIAGALAGAILVLGMLLLFSSIVKSTPMLLIVGIMISYLASSLISLLNFFATQQNVHNFVIWGLGTFSGITLDKVAVMGVLTIAALILSALMVKPLNALLLGNRYAENLGVNIRATRNWLLILSGVLTAIVTAFCGPIGFIGLIVPHIARMIMGTSNHLKLLPATALCGSAVGLLCALIAVLPGSTGVIPINAITPIIGVPIIIYIILNRHNLFYFN